MIILELRPGFAKCQSLFSSIPPLVRPSEPLNGYESISVLKSCQHIGDIRNLFQVKQKHENLAKTPTQVFESFRV
jgi:hypothetical protein